MYGLKWCSEIESWSCYPEFFFLKNWRDLDFYEQKFQETEKFHVRKVKCLVKATERKMSVWRMETNDDRKASGIQGSLWLPLGILFPKQTSSYDEICSFCFHRCRCLNEKIKNQKNTRGSSPWTVCSSHWWPKNLKCLRNGLYLSFWFVHENCDSRTSMCDHLT